MAEDFINVQVTQLHMIDLALDYCLESFKFIDEMLEIVKQGQTANDKESQGHNTSSGFHKIIVMCSVVYGDQVSLP